MMKFHHLRLVVVLLVVALAGMASAQLSLSSAVYSEEKVNFEAPANLGMYIYAYNGSSMLGSYDASCGIQPSIVRGVYLDVMLINFNTSVEEISMRLVSPAVLADLEQLEKVSKEDQGWSVGTRSDTAYMFHLDTRNLPPGHNVAILRCKAKTRNRHSFIIVIRWVTTGHETKDQGFALMVQDLPPDAGNVPFEQLMQAGMFTGFRSRYVILPRDPMQAINQVIPGQTSTAGNQQIQGTNTGLPPDLDLPVNGGQGNGLPADIPLPDQRKALPNVFVRFLDRPLGEDVGKLIDGEMEAVMNQAPNGDLVSISNQNAAIYVWSERPFTGEIRKGDKSVKLEVFNRNGLYWARLCGMTSVLPGTTLLLKSGSNSRTINFTMEVN